ncbi:MAG: hypothetical protein COB53_11210 [Elusimicrobia bacterium]|nr:MAG: hypothetical protein COB53_11210 [Elusimicrobiota bacterium]
MNLILLASIALSVSASDFISYSNRAVQTDSTEAKIELYSRALDAWTAKDGDRNKGVVLANRAALRHQHGDFEGAIQDLDASMKILGENPLARANRGAALARLGRYAEAADDFTQAIRDEPRNPAHYASRAVSHDAIGKTDQAILDYNVLLSIDPSFKDGHKTRGSLFFKVGRYREAIADFDAAIQINRNDRRAYQLKALAEAAIDQSKKNAAVTAHNEEMKRRNAAQGPPKRQPLPELPFKFPDIDPRIFLAGGGLLFLGIGIRALK